RLGSSARELPAAETAESADERESTADSPDRRDAAARVAAPEGRNRKPSDASLGKDAPGRFAMLKALNEAFEYGCAQIDRLQRERDALAVKVASYERADRDLNEALNMGDGSYRP